MTATAATSGYGTTFAKGATTIDEVVGITGPGLSRNMIDATHLSSPDQVKEFVAGLIDGGQVTLDLNWKPGVASQLAFHTDLLAGTSDAYTLTWSDADTTTCTFNAKVMSISPTAPKDDRLSCSVVLQVVTKWTLA